ncbi:FG-GAP repeat domain-containing protein [Nannocystis radixulma]|uniref:VCBS repeat-containing protein n=1 Tax=Nannocystis radixulma TaxID=2995305 RepID=A0ABT5BHZ0_9BACT|nr:VCBS repeat-containing protein [Nannocystis radixulma]MDC0673774.1 VCBS repeat-containing protein [Nannocystis radixulma]
MPSHRLASGVLAAVLGPAGCMVHAPCDDPGSVCLATDAVEHVRVAVMPDALVVADLDADGTRDLVGASGPAGTITAWISGSATTWSIDQEVAGLVVADLDGDGHLDLATALPRADAVAVIRGRGGRSFMEPERHSAGAVPRALIAADLDAEGPPELITADNETGTVTVLHQFVAAPPIVVGPGPRALAVGDLDSDGHVDVAVALADADAVQVLRGDGRGGLSPAALHPVGTAPYDLVAADFDLDGLLDLATADSLDDTVSVLFGDGAGDLRARTTWPTVSLPSNLVVSQPPGESPVLGVLSPTTSTVERLDPRTGETYTGLLLSDPRSIADDAGTFIAAGRTVSRLSIGTGIRLTPLWQEEGSFFYRWFVDLDGDGTDELLVWDFETEAEAVTLRDDGVLVTIPVGIEQPETIEAADLTGDGRPDLLIGKFNRFAISIQQPDGTFTASPVETSEGQRALADIDADGVVELLIVDAADGEGRVDVFRSDDTGELTLAQSSTFALAERPDGASVIDGDGDDLPDLMVSAEGKKVYLEDAQGPARDLALDFSGFFSIAFDDLDGDGRLDAVGCGGVLQIIDDVLGLAEVRSLAQDGWCNVVDVFDLDGDSDLEIVSRQYDSGHLGDTITFTPWQLLEGEWLQRGPQSLSDGREAGFAQLDGVGPPELWIRNMAGIAVMQVDFGLVLLEHERLRLGYREQLGFADIDADGAADMLAFGENISLARADGSGGFETLTHLWRPSASPQIFHGVFADLDGDGAPQFAGTTLLSNDILVAGVALDGLLEPRELPTNASPISHLFARDVDRDGLVDLLVFDTAFRFHGELLRGRGHGEFAEPVQLVLENTAVRNLAVHDMDRDGVLDIVALRLDPAPGEIMVAFGVGDGTFGPTRRWSTSAPILLNETPLVPGDFDRDGHVEIVLAYQNDLLWIRGGESSSARVVRQGIAAYTSADLDRDGHPELLAAGNASGDRTLLHVGRSRSDGSFGFTTHAIATAGVREIQTADIDGDGELDIILVDDLGAAIVRRVP